MFTYLALIKLTPEGREGLKDAQKYLDKVRFLVEQQKGELATTFALMGPWDFVAIVKYPTVDAAFTAHARIAALDVIEVETFPVEEIDVFIKALV